MTLYPNSISASPNNSKIKQLDLWIQFDFSSPFWAGQGGKRNGQKWEQQLPSPPITHCNPTKSTGGFRWLYMEGQSGIKEANKAEVKARALAVVWL